MYFKVLYILVTYKNMSNHKNYVLILFKYSHHNTSPYKKTTTDNLIKQNLNYLLPFFNTPNIFNNIVYFKITLWLALFARSLGRADAGRAEVCAQIKGFCLRINKSEYKLFGRGDIGSRLFGPAGKSSVLRIKLIFRYSYFSGCSEYFGSKSFR